MTFEYKIQLSVDLGNAVPEVGALLKELNTGLSEFGCDEKLMVRAELFSCTLTSPRELTEQDQETVKKALLEEFQRLQPAWNVKVESFRRKPGNVQQQAA